MFFFPALLSDRATNEGRAAAGKVTHLSLDQAIGDNCNPTCS